MLPCRNCLENNWKVNGNTAECRYCGREITFYARKHKKHKRKPAKLNLRPKYGVKTERWKAYAAYLQSSEWRAFRTLVFRQRTRRCERCGWNGKGPRHVHHLHHLTYARLGHELPEDVQVLCPDCHRIVESQK